MGIKISNKISNLLLTVSSIVIFIIFIEVISYLFLIATGKQHYSLFLVQRTGNVILDSLDCGFGHHDPNLGYAHGQCSSIIDQQIPGFVLYGAPLGTAEVTIAVLGGSTTDPIVMSDREDIDWHTWPLFLWNLCDEAGLTCTILNGGVGGFTSSQEPMKLVRDVLPAKPDIVISLNGINEWYFFDDGLNRKYTFVSHFQRDTLRRISGVGHDTATAFRPFLNSVLPNMVNLVRSILHRLGLYRNSTKQEAVKHNSCLEWAERDVIAQEARASWRKAPLGNDFHPVEWRDGYIDGVYMGFPNKGPSSLEAWQIWERNIGDMSAISNGRGVKYFTFLQPTLAVGEYDYDRNESGNCLFSDEGNHEKYIAEINILYDNLKPICAEKSFCFDISDIFMGQSIPLYSDARHPNAQGNKLQAEAIFNVLTTSGALPIASNLRKLKQNKKL